MKDNEAPLNVPRYRTVKSLRGAAGSLAKPLDARAMRKIAYEDRQAAGPTSRSKPKG